MSNEDFEALLGLIQALIYYHVEAHAHPNDQPRNRRMMEERQEAIEHARSVLVL